MSSIFLYLTGNTFFSWNLVPKLIQICRIQWWSPPFSIFKKKYLFSVFGQKYPLWANLIQEIKILSLNWNLVSKLIWICRIKSWSSLFLFSTGNNHFWANLVQHYQNCQLKLNLSILTNSNLQNSKVKFIFPVFDQKYSSWANVVEKLNTVSLS